MTCFLWLRYYSRTIKVHINETLLNPLQSRRTYKNAAQLFFVDVWWHLFALYISPFSFTRKNFLIPLWSSIICFNLDKKDNCVEEKDRKYNFEFSKKIIRSRLLIWLNLFILITQPTNYTTTLYSKKFIDIKRYILHSHFKFFCFNET